MSLLVFVPNLPGRDLTEVRGSSVSGLVSDLDTDDFFGCTQITGGPDGHGGLLFSAWNESCEPPLIGYFPDQQNWSKFDGVYYGWNHDDVPTAKSLERLRCPAGDVDIVQMNDGSLWEIPVLRRPVSNGKVLPSVVHASSLPSSCFPVGDSDTWSMSVLPEYVDLFEQSRIWFDHTMSTEEQTFQWREVFSYACDVINLKYRYPLGVHSAFGAKFVTTENVFDIIQVSCGYRLAVQALSDPKKKIVS